MQTGERMLQRARALRIRVARVIRGTKFGVHHNAQITRSGIEFDALREYQHSDDIRAIDWKASARVNKLIVRSYRETRNRTVILVVDFTASMEMGSQGILKETVVRDVAIMLAYAAEIAGDALGVIMVRDQSVVWIPPRSGKEHMNSVIHALSHTTCSGSVSDWDTINRYIHQSIRRNAIVVVLSDGIDHDFTPFVCRHARQHVVIFGRILDEVEYTIPLHIGLCFRDPETGALLNLTTHTYRQKAQEHITLLLKRQEQEMRKGRVNVVALTTSTHYEDALLRLLQNGVI
jgi:uncharacterized protein (DUF58 family)